MSGTRQEWTVTESARGKPSDPFFADAFKRVDEDFYRWRAYGPETSGTTTIAPCCLLTGSESTLNAAQQAADEATEILQAAQAKLTADELADLRRRIRDLGAK